MYYSIKFILWIQYTHMKNYQGLWIFQCPFLLTRLRKFSTNTYLLYTCTRILFIQTKLRNRSARVKTFFFLDLKRNNKNIFFDGWKKQQHLKIFQKIYAEFFRQVNSFSIFLSLTAHKSSDREEVARAGPPGAKSPYRITESSAVSSAAQVVISPGKNSPVIETGYRQSQMYN